MTSSPLLLLAITGSFRPAVIVQSDALPESHASVIVCPMTSALSSASDFRITIEPANTNGLRTTSQVMADKPIAISRERVGRVIGQLESPDLDKIAVALALVLDLRVTR